MEGARKPVTHTVTIDSTRFDPASLAIQAGETVIWINKDVIPHTASSQAGRWDSGEIAAGASSRQTFDTKGDFDYVCAFHPTMRARLRVR